jgi:hypothetical protein
MVANGWDRIGALFAKVLQAISRANLGIISAENCDTARGTDCLAQEGCARRETIGRDETLSGETGEATMQVQGVYYTLTSPELEDMLVTL